MSESRCETADRAYNKRYFGERIESELSIRFATTPVSLIFLDIDHFKRINDVHDTQTGDQLLVQLATVVMAMLGDDDGVRPYGGEEFAVHRARE
jgi:diguanylate cyclase (GGDEF)-like protein